MSVIIIEGVLFVALLATGAALLYFVLVQFTPVGVRLRQTQNRRQIDRAAELGRTQPLRTVDAIHLAAADRLPSPTTFATFDPAQIPVAVGLGFDVLSG